MNNKYINIYNNLINLLQIKILYKSLNQQDNFSDRLTFFLFFNFINNYIFLERGQHSYKKFMILILTN